MHRKYILLIVSLLFLLCGCSESKENNVIENEEIKKVVIYYYSDTERELGNDVELDLTKEGECVKYSNYYDETSKQFKIHNIDDIKNFILKNIFDYEPKDNRSINDKSEEKQNLWSIRVTTNLDRYGFSGYDEYPDYWDELWELIVSVSDAEDISEFRVEE